MEKRTIVVFTTSYKPFIGGAELAIQEIAKRLNDDFDFFIITAKQKYGLPKKEMIPEGTILRLGFGFRALDKLLLPFLGFWKALQISKNRPAIFWGVMISYASIAAFFAKLIRPQVPFILTIQEGDREWGKWPSAWWWSIVPRAADYIVCISNFLADCVREKGYRGPIAIIPNGVNERLLAIHRSDHLLSSRLNPRGEKIFSHQPDSLAKIDPRIAGSDADSDSKWSDLPIIFSASRLVYKNGIDILLESAAKLKDEFAFKIILAGDGPERDRLKGDVQRLGLDARVEFLGSIPYEQLPEHYARADIFVRPSRSEGLGSAFLEAMAAGLVTVGTSVGGIPDFLKDGKTGFLVKPNNAEDLARVLRKIFMMNANERRCIIEEARRCVQEKYTWSIIAKQMKNILSLF